MSLLELGSQVGEMCATAQGREAYCLLKQTTRDAEQRRTLLFGAAAGAAGGLVLGLLIGRLF